MRTASPSSLTPRPAPATPPTATAALRARPCAPLTGLAGRRLAPTTAAPPARSALRTSCIPLPTTTSTPSSSRASALLAASGSCARASVFAGRELKLCGAWRRAMQMLNVTRCRAVEQLMSRSFGHQNVSSATA
ncbi:hypothetical protein CC85DRAFT_61917, partial [Cutaneotrichosporon oleaginosum]